jgi:hypothetical protein
MPLTFKFADLPIRVQSEMIRDRLRVIAEQDGMLQEMLFEQRERYPYMMHDVTSRIVRRYEK